MEDANVKLSHAVRSFLLQAFLSAAQHEGLVTAAHVAADSEDVSNLWYLREHISVALSRKGLALPGNL